MNHASLSLTTALSRRDCQYKRVIQTIPFSFSAIRITGSTSIHVDQAENTDQLQLDTEYTRNVTEISNSRVSSIDIDATGTIISDISTNTETASRALDDALIKCKK
jgi:hypothetical protein